MQNGKGSALRLDSYFRQKASKNIKIYFQYCVINFYFIQITLKSWQLMWNTVEYSRKPWWFYKFQVIVKKILNFCFKSSSKINNKWKKSNNHLKIFRKFQSNDSTYIRKRQLKSFENNRVEKKIKIMSYMIKTFVS